MFGAILGDIIGSRFEFDRGGKTKKFKLFTAEDSFTDDTVMTVAVAEGLLNAGKMATVEQIHEEVTKSMRKWGWQYPSAGYGGRFFHWLFSDENPHPYGSYGNGSAMRVSAAGWLYDSLERTLEVAKATAEVTHNHVEGIKGAQCTAAVIYLARTGKSKEEIRDYVVNTFGYDVSESLNQLRKRHRHVETCMDSLPKALVSFFEGENYEDVIRNAVSLGGDTDTLAAIAGAMAEAFYGIELNIIVDGLPFLPDDLLKVVNQFSDVKNERGSSENSYQKNTIIKEAVDLIRENCNEENIYNLVNAIVVRMLMDGEAPMPMVDVNNVLGGMDLNQLTLNNDFRLEQDLVLRYDTMIDGDKTLWFPLFTDEQELHEGNTTNVVLNVPIENIIYSAIESDEVAGVVINPFTAPQAIPKGILRTIVEFYQQKKQSVC